MQPGDAIRMLDDATREVRDGDAFEPPADLPSSALRAMDALRTRASANSDLVPDRADESQRAPAPDPVPDEPVLSSVPLDVGRSLRDPIAVLREIDSLTAGARQEISASVEWVHATPPTPEWAVDLDDPDTADIDPTPVEMLDPDPADDPDPEPEARVPDAEPEPDPEPGPDPDPDPDPEPSVPPAAATPSAAPPVVVPPVNLVLDAESFAASFAAAIAPLLEERHALPAATPVNIVPSQIVAPVSVPKRSFWENSWHPDVLLSVVAMIIIMIVLVAFAV